MLTLYQMATNNLVHACVPVGVVLNVTSYNDISLYDLNGRLVEARTVFVVSLHLKLNLSNICGLWCVLFPLSLCFGHNDSASKQTRAVCCRCRLDGLQTTGKKMCAGLWLMQHPNVTVEWSLVLSLKQILHSLALNQIDVWNRRVDAERIYLFLHSNRVWIYCYRSEQQLLQGWLNSSLICNLTILIFGVFIHLQSNWQQSASAKNYICLQGFYFAFTLIDNEL